MSPLIVLIFGRSGCGKGTQAKLLVDKFNLIYIGSGDLLRKRLTIEDFSGKKIKEVLGEGNLTPTTVIFQLWVEMLERIKKEQNNHFNGIIFDGSPRKLLETQLLQESLEWYEWDKRIRVLLIEVSEEEAVKRLTARGRYDDNQNAMKGRMDFYNKEVIPIIDYYEEKGLLIRINGEQSVEKVYEEILAKLKVKDDLN